MLLITNEETADDSSHIGYSLIQVFIHDTSVEIGSEIDLISSPFDALSKRLLRVGVACTQALFEGLHIGRKDKHEKAIIAVCILDIESPLDIDIHDNIMSGFEHLIDFAA